MSSKALDEATVAIDKVISQFKLDLKKEYDKIDKDVLDEKNRRLKSVEKEIQQKKVDLDEEWKRLDFEKKSIREERAALEHEIKMMEDVHTVQKGQVKMDVGGQLFSTSVATLTKENGSMLAAMFSGRHEIIKNDEGRVFIDRDGKYFSYILEYLRDGEWDAHMLADPLLYSKVQKEANYFALDFPDQIDSVPSRSSRDRADSLPHLEKGTFTWASNRKGPHISLTNGNKTAATTTAWNQVQAEQPLLPGTYYELTINSVCATNRNLFGIVFGVGPNNVTLHGSNAIIGYNTMPGYGYVCNNGSIFPTAAHAGTMATAAARDVMRCSLGLDQTLSFAKNGVTLCSFKITPSYLVLYPTVAIAEGQVTLT